MALNLNFKKVVYCREARTESWTLPGKNPNFPNEVLQYHPRRLFVHRVKMTQFATIADEKPDSFQEFMTIGEKRKLK